MNQENELSLHINNNQQNVFDLDKELGVVYIAVVAVLIIAHLRTFPLQSNAYPRAIQSSAQAINASKANESYTPPFDANKTNKNENKSGKPCRVDAPMMQFVRGILSHYFHTHVTLPPNVYATTPTTTTALNAIDIITLNSW